MLHCAIGFFLLVLQAVAAELPAGAELHLRLTTKVSSEMSRPGDAVTGVLIVPALAGGQVAIPSGMEIVGTVQSVETAAKPDVRATLWIDISGLKGPGGKVVPVSAKLKNVDNARESIDEAGVIIGILPSETLSAMMDKGISKLGEKQTVLGEILAGVKGAMVKQATGAIEYEPGIELTFELLKPLVWDAPAESKALQPIRDEEALHTLVNRQPFQTFAEKPRKPSDITNLMFIGTLTQVEEAFKKAGWATAHALDRGSVLETFRSVAEMRGYKEAPMSVLRLENRPPELLYQKGNNTFAKRHHLRIWKRPVDFDGRTVWVSSSTHDIGIEFSEANRTFIHVIDPQIDRERAKIVSDLLFTDRVESLALVERGDVPKKTRNATGDDIVTDGRMAVVILR